MTILWMSMNTGERHSSLHCFRFAARADGGLHARAVLPEVATRSLELQPLRCVLKQHYTEADTHTERVDADQERSRRHAR